jgi:hypothetical protein
VAADGVSSPVIHVGRKLSFLTKSIGDKDLSDRATARSCRKLKRYRFYFDAKLLGLLLGFCIPTEKTGQRNQDYFFHFFGKLSRLCQYAYDICHAKNDRYNLLE